jgi:hypothetical protein
MGRINSKADLNAALEQAARTIVSARAGAAKMSRAELKRALAKGKLPRKQRALVDAFLKFAEEDLNLDAEITASDVGRALEEARKRLFEKYDLDEQKLTKEEVAQLAVAGKRAVDLAKALKAFAAGEL